MSWDVGVALGGLFVTMLGGFIAVLLKLGQQQQQMALLWAWYLSECGPGIPGGRRRTDPPPMLDRGAWRPPGGSLE